MSTQNISTAARRIARTVNDTPTALTVRFDADGRTLSVDPAGMWPAKGPDDYFLRLDGERGRNKLTQARAQMLVEAMTRALAAHDGDAFLAREDFYLHLRDAELELAGAQ